jgi:hypothetical protein
MNKTLSKSKNKKIVGGNKFNFNVDSDHSDDKNKITITANNEINGINKEVKLFFYKKKNDTLHIAEDDINDIKNLKIITSNITDVKYYEPNIDNNNGKLNKNYIVDYMNKFDTCVIVDFNNICYIFLYVYTSDNKAIKDFNDNHISNNLKVLNALMIANFKELGLDIKFVNKFVAVVNGFVDEKKIRTSATTNVQSVSNRSDSSNIFTRNTSNQVDPIQYGIEDLERHSRIHGTGGSRKKINNYKILNNLILILNKINKVKNLTKTKATKPTKPKATKPTKPKVTKPTKSKATKPTKSKATKPTKPKATKPTKPKATKPTKPKATKPTKPKAKKPKATKKI